MKDSYRNSRDKLIGQSLDFLWRQWTSLGVPGNRAYKGDTIIDPEALVLITTELGRYDSRLLDLAIDWLHGEGKRINLQRLKELQKGIGISDGRVLSGIAEILMEQSVLRKWGAVSGWDSVRGMFIPGAAVEPLFLSVSGMAEGADGPIDQRFEKYGLLRLPWSPRDAGQAPRPDLPANLLFTLRSLFGVNARAEIMAWLLTHETGHPAAIARDTGYFSKSIQATLNEMEESGVIRSERMGREKNFRLRQDDWLRLLHLPEEAALPRWIAWPWVYYLMFRTIMLLGKTGSEDTSPLLHSILQRDFLDEILSMPGEKEVRREMVAAPHLTGKKLEDAIARDVNRLGHLLENDFRQSSDAS